MPETHNGTTLKQMTYNGQKVKKWKHDGVLVYSAGNIVTYYVDGTSYQEEVEYGNSVLSPTSFTPSKDGYTFVGWSLSEGGAVLSECVMDSDPITLYAIMIQTVTSYSYNGGVQSFTAPVAGTYLLQVWGAQGGNAGPGGNTEAVGYGGYGGYAKGNIALTKGQTIYICIGGMGSVVDYYNGGGYGSVPGGGGYNGGGNGCGTVFNGYATNSAGGGGATHIAKNTNRGLLKNYASYKSEILIVAGGGGGSFMGDSGGAGGGTSGGGNYPGTQSGAGYTDTSNGWQSAGGFGYGASYTGNTDDDGDRGGGSGSGGGWYGGGGGLTYQTNGAGGSGYIGGVTNGSMSNGARSGNGCASVTFVSV